MPLSEPLDPALIAALSELATSVQRKRTIDGVLQVAGEGVRPLGMRLAAFQIDGDEMVLRHLATSPQRHAAIEQMIGRRLMGLRAPLAGCSPAAEIVSDRHNMYGRDL